MKLFEFKNSTALRSCIYDTEDRRLTIEFTDGTSRSYLGVPEKVFLELLEARSSGLYFNMSIRGVYPEA